VGVATSDLLIQYLYFPRLVAGYGLLGSLNTVQFPKENSVR